MTPTNIDEQLLYRTVQRFRGGLVFKAHRRVYHSTLGLRVIKKKKKKNIDAALVIAGGVCTKAGRRTAHSPVNAAHLRKPRPDSGLGFQIKVFTAFQDVPSWLGSGSLNPKPETPHPECYTRRL